MKKKTKQLLLLVAVLVLMIGAYATTIFLQNRAEEKAAEQEKETEPLQDVTEFSVSDIASYHYMSPQTELGFLVTEEGYVNDEDENFPVNSACVEGQLTAIGDLTCLQVIGNGEKEDFGVTEPQITIQVVLKDGTKRSFAVGDKALFDDNYYLLDVEKDTVYLIDSTIYSEFTIAWSAMVQKESTVSVSTDQILDVTVESAVFEPFYVTYDELQEVPWSFTTSQGTFAADTDAMLDKLSIYSTYVFKTVYEYDCKEFAQYGLKEPQTTLTVRYYVKDAEGNLTEEIRSLVMEFGNQAEDGTYYVRMNGSSFVYGMSETYTEKLASFDASELKNQEETTE
ncbi:MAG: DUF4340 domain-containing protein [Lachnospiraceae bacterium]